MTTDRCPWCGSRARQPRGLRPDLGVICNNPWHESGAFTEFSNDYELCVCGGWDEKWASADGSLRLRGRSNHRHGCDFGGVA